MISTTCFYWGYPKLAPNVSWKIPSSKLDENWGYHHFRKAMKNGGSFHSYFDITRGYPNTIRYETTQPIVISEVYHDLPHCFGSIVML